MKLTYSGFIEIKYDDAGNHSYVCLVEDNTVINLFKKFRGINDLYECPVFVSYFISAKRMTKSEAIKKQFKKIYGDITALEGEEHYEYSEYTKGTNYWETLTVGGHSLESDLIHKVGKYCILTIELKQN